MKPLIICLLALMANTSSDKLIGRWESISSKGNVTGVVFKDDNTFEGYVNRKPFVSGTYTFNDSIFTLEDNGCMGVRGTYKFTFYSNNDSFRIELMHDECEGRGNGMNDRVFGRVK